MKRFHVHVSVPEIEPSIRFYSTVFGQEPAIVKPDYSKWMLDDPRLNFAISTGRAAGINHLGFQVETDGELRAMQGQLERADQRLVAEEENDCCYARSDKYWITDPTGIAWETFHTLGGVPVFSQHQSKDAGCCTPGPARGARACCA